MKTQNNGVEAPKLVEVEWVLDYRGAEQICPGEEPKATRIKIRFLRKATRFCPPVSHTLGESRNERDVPIDRSRRKEGNQNSHNHSHHANLEDSGQPPVLTGF